MKKWILGMTAVLFLAGCSQKETLSEDVRFMPKEDVIYTYEFNPHYGEVQKQQESFLHRVDNYHIMTDPQGLVGAVYEEDENGLTLYSPEALDPEQLVKTPEVIKDGHSTVLFEYPLTKGALVENGDYLYKVTDLHAELKTKHKKYKDVVRLEVYYKGSANIFTYYLKQDVGIIGIQNKNSTNGGESLLYSIDRPDNRSKKE